MRLTLVIHALTDGGAERVIATMANHWANEGNVVTLLTLDSPENDAYEISRDVRRASVQGLRESTNFMRAICNNVRRLVRLRRAIHQSNPDAVISFTDKMNILTLIACFGLRRKIIVSERVDPRHHEISRVWSFLRSLTYRWCDALVVQTRSVHDYFVPFVHPEKINVIPNAVQFDPKNDDAICQRKPWVVAMGRLAKQKGFDLLIEAFRVAVKEHGDWKLKIVGEGIERASLIKSINDYGLAESVELCGWSDVPDEWLSQASLFVLSSRYEGFPNVLLEAMSRGLPVVSFDCPSGPSEIVRHEVDGLLIPAENVGELAQALDRMMSNADERATFGNKAREVSSRFSREEFFRCWEALIGASQAATTREQSV